MPCQRLDATVPPTRQDPRKPNSFGLVGLRERVYLLGGEAAIISAPGSGTNIEVRLPLTSHLTEQ
jgi:signal transduction histidine kinase